jgi:hypothetical protein
MRRHARPERRRRNGRERPKNVTPALGLDREVAEACGVERTEHGDFRIVWQVADLVDTDRVPLGRQGRGSWARGACREHEHPRDGRDNKAQEDRRHTTAVGHGARCTRVRVSAICMPHVSLPHCALAGTGPLRHFRRGHTSACVWSAVPRTSTLAPRVIRVPGDRPAEEPRTRSDAGSLLSVNVRKQ